MGRQLRRTVWACRCWLQKRLICTPNTDGTWSCNQFKRLVRKAGGPQWLKGVGRFEKGGLANYLHRDSDGHLCCTGSTCGGGRNTRDNLYTCKWAKESGIPKCPRARDSKNTCVKSWIEYEHAIRPISSELMNACENEDTEG